MASPQIQLDASWLAHWRANDATQEQQRRAIVKLVLNIALENSLASRSFTCLCVSKSKGLVWTGPAAIARERARVYLSPHALFGLQFTTPTAANLRESAKDRVR